MWPISWWSWGADWHRTDDTPGRSWGALRAEEEWRVRWHWFSVDRDRFPLVSSAVAVVDWTACQYL